MPETPFPLEPIMKFRTLSFSAVLVTVFVLASGITLAKSHESGENDAVSALATAKITLAEAISVAENSVHGRATKAELEIEDGKSLFEVEVVDSLNAVYDVSVDAATGKVLTSHADSIDPEQDDNEEKDD